MNEKETVGWRALFADAWFFPGLFLAMFGGSFPIIALLRIVGVDHNFAAPIHAIIQAYHDGMAAFTALVEPWFRPMLLWLGGLIGFKLQLYPHWSHLFVLALVFPLAVVRTRVHHAEWIRRRGAYVIFVVTLPFVACAAVLAGLLNPNGEWWNQFFIAAFPLVLVICGRQFGAVINHVINGDLRKAAARFPDLLTSILIFGVLVALILTKSLALIVSLVPLKPFSVPLSLRQLIPGVGLLALGAFYIVVGTQWLVDGIRFKDAFAARAGLTILSGFAGAGLVFVADWAIKTIG